MAPGAGLALEQVGQRVAVHVDPGAALGGGVERGPFGEVEALQRVAGGRIREAQGREGGLVGGDGGDLGELAARDRN